MRARERADEAHADKSDRPPLAIAREIETSGGARRNELSAVINGGRSFVSALAAAPASWGGVRAAGGGPEDEAALRASVFAALLVA